MTRLHWITLAAMTAAFVTSGLTATSAEARAKCVRVGATATMLTEDLAKYSARTVLANSIALKGKKPAGRVAMKCTTGKGLPTCVARQRAC